MGWRNGERLLGGTIAFVQTKPDLWGKVEPERLDPAKHVEAFREGNVLTIWVFWELESFQLKLLK